MDTSQRRHVRLETTIATTLCSLLPALVLYWTYAPFPVPVWGFDGVVGFAAKGTFVPVLLMTSLMTLGARGKVRKGLLARLPHESMAWLRWVPRMLAVRAVLFAAGAGVVSCAGTAMLALLLNWVPFDKASFALFNMVMGAAMGLCMTPLIQCAALADVLPNKVSVQEGAV